MRIVLLAAAWTLLAFVASAQNPASRPAGGAACSSCDDKQSVSCPTCDGKGRGAIACLLCGGGGSLPCHLCPLVDRLLKLKGTDFKLGRGKLPCRNNACDRKGQMKWFDGKKQTCRACDGKGSYDCPVCRDGAAKCPRCAGRGKVDQTCFDCGGRGGLPCADCSPAGKRSECASCGGKKKHACVVCKGGKGSGAKCGTCRAEGRVVCQRCAGSKRLPCNRCGCSGQVRYESEGGKSAGIKKDDACEGRGFLTCEDCAGAGLVECAKCEKGVVADACPWCDEGSVPCFGCGVGRWRGAETYGRAYAALGKHAAAAKHLETALAAAPKELDALLKAAAGGEDPRADLVTNLLSPLRKEAEQRLKARLEAARAAKPQPPAPKGL
jgi:hypothetical protein